MFIGGRMAAEQTTIEVNVLTKGLAEATVSAQKLHDIMKATSDIAGSIRVPTAVQAAQEQVAVTNTRRAPPVMAESTPKGGGGGKDYAISRGIAGTGAEGRDFGKQAQGLGGLVHVYATFAANLFAVSAAFSALSKAADTTNIIKGLDQLGAQSGRSLGGVAKAMVEATGGALSLREAMTSTALASSAGMTNAAMLRMTEVAKKASLALGRDMGDSMDRLTKGIAKVQPELLDELGIMARVIPSQEKYARELGKSVSALTDFEKKQAFANAVLEEGERKFSSINIDTNPYTQLSASLANVAQTGLELVNTVLGPLASSLAKSPTALGLALTGIVGILLKQAIPALGQYRKGLEAVNAENLKKVSEMQKIQGEAGYNYDTKIVGERARKKYLAETGFAKKSLDEQKKITLEADKIADAAAQESAKRATSTLGHETVTNKIRDRMYQDAAVSGSKYTVSQIQGAYGMRAAFSQLGEEINTLRSKGNMIDVGGGLMRQVPPINGFRAAIVGATGVIAILGTTIGTLINAFAPWILAITAVVSGVAFLIDHFRTANKEVQASSKAFEGVTGAVKTIGDVLDAVDKKPFLEQISNATVQAKAASINELSSSLALLTKRNNEASRKVAGGGYADKFEDLRVGKVLGKGLGNLFTGTTLTNTDKSNLSKQLADGVQESIIAGSKIIQGSPAEQAFKDSIKSILGITYKDAADLQKQLSEIPDALISKYPRLQKALEEASRAMNNAASAGKELDDAWTAASKSFDNLITSLNITDPLGKLGDETIKVGIAMSKAFQDPKNRIAELSKTAMDMSRLRFLSPGTQREMLEYAKTVEESAKKVAKLTEKLELAKVAEANFAKDDPKSANTVRAQQNVANIKGQIATEQIKQDNPALFLKAQDEVFISGAKKIEVSISQAFAKANIALSQTILANAGNTKQGIDALADLAKQQIDVESNNLNAMLQLAKATSDLAKVQEEFLIETLRAKLNPNDADFKKQSSKLTERKIVLEESKQPITFQKLTKDLGGTDPIAKQAAQMNYPVVSMTESVRSQLASNTAKKQAIDIDTEGKKILLDIDAIVRRNELIAKGLSLKVAELGIITQNSQYESEAAVLQKQNVERRITILGQEKERLQILGQIEDAEKRASKATDLKTKAAAQASIAKFRLDLAQKEQMNEKDLQILSLKNIQEQKVARIAEFNYAKDFQLLNNTINSESLSAIQNLSSGYLDFINQQKLTIELSNLKLNYDKQSNAELESQLILQDQLNKLRKDTTSSPDSIANAERSLAESKAKSAQLDLKYAYEIRNLNAANLKTRLDGQESIRKDIADTALAEITSANKVLGIRIGMEQKLLQAKVNLGYVSEQTAARQTEEVSKKLLANELALQAAENAKLEKDNLEATKIREELLAAAKDKIDKDYQARLVERTQQTKDAIDRIMAQPTAEPGVFNPGAVSADVKASEAAKALAAGSLETEALAASRVKATTQLEASTARENKKSADAFKQKLKDQGALIDEKKQEIALNREIQDQQAKIAQITKDQSFYTTQAEQAAKSLAATFGEFGKALGDVINNLAKSSANMATYEQDRIKALQQIRAAEGNPAEKAQATENLAKLDQKYSSQRLDDLASIAAASASIFEKDSKGYNKMMAIEKILHLMKIADMVMQQARFIKDWFVRMTSTKAEIALATTKAAVGAAPSAIGAVGKVADVAGNLIPGNTDPGLGKVDYGLFTSGAPKLANALGSGPSLTGGLSSAAAPAAAAGEAGAAAAAGEAGAAAAAGEAGGIMSMLGSAGAGIMAAAPWIAGGIALLSLFGGKDKPKGPTPEELASVSGTGMKYNADGKLEATGTGALGDAKAANEGIAKSIDYLAKINYENLQFDKNKALVALEAIRDNTQNFVKAVGATGKIGDLTAGGVELNKKSGFLGFSSSSTTLAASGVKITGTIGEIADSLGGAIKKFEDIRRSKSSFWGLSSSTSVTRSETDVSDAAAGFIKNTIGSFRTAIQESAAAFGQNGGLLKPIIDQMDISFTAYQTGESSADFANRVQEELGNKLDEAVKAVFPGIESLASKFQNFGETLSEFAMRVQGDSEQIKFAFQSIGQTYVDSGGTGSQGAMNQRSAEQSLVKAFGGSQELFAAIDKYGNSMLTEAERLAPVRDNVNKKLLELFPALQSGGKSLITTKQEFDTLRKSLDPLNPATADLWAQMTRLGPAFASVTEEVKKLTEAELKKAKEDQLSTILALKGDDLSKAKALTLTRQRELDAMDDLIKPNQLYIYALQDEAAAKDKLQGSYDKVKTAITSTIDSLKSQVTVLQDYKKNLQMGDKGNLTPQEAYAASKGQLESASSLAQQTLGAGASKAEIAARDKAVSSLPNLIDQFLTQSKTSYASGDQYQADYSWVNSLLDTTTEQLTSQETDAEKQLTALNDSVSYLTTIDENTKTTATLMSEFLANQVSYETASASATTLLTEELTGILANLPTKVKGFAMGGLANRGMNMVGENGPELIDFASPGRVYTAKQTSAFGDNTALVAELKALRDEMSQLRSEQKEQTGHIIQSNYDANQKNAQAVSNVTENAIKQQTWKERSQVVVA